MNLSHEYHNTGHYGLDYSSAYSWNGGSVSTQTTVATSPIEQSPTSASGLSEIVIVTVPAVVAYYLGWAYLYYYMGAFGIGVSELDMGIETMFIYSMPAVILLAKSYGTNVVGIAVVIVVLRWFMLRYFTSATEYISRFRHYLVSSSWMIRGVFFFLVIMLAGMVTQQFLWE